MSGALLTLLMVDKFHFKPFKFANQFWQQSNFGEWKLNQGSLIQVRECKSVSSSVSSGNDTLYGEWNSPRKPFEHWV